MKDLLQQALDALYDQSFDGEARRTKKRAAISALRDAIAQPESEPVGQVKQKHGHAEGSFFVLWSKIVKPGDLLYTAPVRPDYAPLTNAQAEALAHAESKKASTTPMTQDRAEELAHRRCKRYIFIDAEAPYQFDTLTLMDFVRDIEQKARGDA